MYVCVCVRWGYNLLSTWSRRLQTNSRQGNNRVPPSSPLPSPSPTKHFTVAASYTLFVGQVANFNVTGYANAGAPVLSSTVSGLPRTARLTSSGGAAAGLNLTMTASYTAGARVHS